MPKHKTTHVPSPKTPRGCPYARPDTPPTPPARTAARTPPAATPPMPESRTDAATPAVDDAAPPPPPPSPLSLPIPVSPSASDDASVAAARPALAVGALAVYTHHGGQEWHVTILALDGGAYAKVKADKGPRMKVPRARLRTVLGVVAGDEGDDGGPNAEVAAAMEGGA
jgi:hypothetical protein